MVLRQQLYGAIMNFALVSRPELNLLVELPKSAICVYLALASYCRDHSNCWPSIKTLQRVLGDKISIRSIYDGLKALEEIGLIVRNHRRSTKRFMLRVREMFMKLRQANCETSHNETANDRNIRKRGKKNFLNRNKGKRSGFMDQLRPEQHTSEDIKDQLMSEYTMNGVIDERLPRLMSSNDWEWLKKYHPEKAEHLSLIGQ